MRTAIIPVPLHKPKLVAEQISTQDVLSNGRAEVGLGKGYQKYQFDRLGVDLDINMEKYKESIALICAALRGRPFEFSGQYFKIPDTVIFPQPIQQPPPIWIVVNTTIVESVEFAIERNMNIFTGVLEPFSKLTHIHEKYPALFERLPLRKIGTQRTVFVSYKANEILEALDEVRWNARTSVSQRYDFGQIINGKAIAKLLESEPNNEQVLEEHVIFGTPDQCIKKTKVLQEKLGCNYFSGSFSFGNLSHEKALNSMRLFAKEVMPAFATSLQPL